MIIVVLSSTVNIVGFSLKVRLDLGFMIYSIFLSSFISILGFSCKSGVGSGFMNYSIILSTIKPLGLLTISLNKLKLSG